MPIGTTRHTGSLRAQPAALRAISRHRANTLTSICQSAIESMILDGEIERGARINEVALAAQLKVSRGPVREACSALAQAGLLESRAHRGFFVRKLVRKEVIDLYDLRAGLMRLVGELAALRATGKQVHDLRDQVVAMQAASQRAGAAKYQALNAAFHETLVDMTDNPRLKTVHEGLSKELRLFRRRGLDNAAAMAASNAEHQAIVEAIAAHDAARAAATMEYHILQGKARFLAAAADALESAND